MARSLPETSRASRQDATALAIRAALATIEDVEPLITVRELCRLLDHYIHTDTQAPPAPNAPADSTLVLRGLVRGRPGTACTITPAAGLLLLDAMHAHEASSVAQPHSGLR